MDFKKEYLEKVHNATVNVLQNTGMRFLHPRAIEIFKKHGIRVDGETVYFTEDQLMYWVKKAPSSFRVYARNPKYNITVGGDNVNILTGSGPAHVSDYDGNIRVATSGDEIRLIKLYEQNPDINSNGGGIVQAQDVDKRHRITTIGFTGLLYTEKVLEIESVEDASAGYKDGEEYIELIKMAYDLSNEDLLREPRCIAITDTNSPLMFDKKMLEMIFFCAEYGQVLCISACSMAGTTAPVTLAGNIVLTNAEVLAGIALSQMVREGAPVAYGCQSTAADMGTAGIAIGAPEGALTYALGAAMARYYGIPSRGGGGLTDSSGITAQAGYESMITFMSTYGSHTNLIEQSSGIMGSYATFSEEKLMLDFEIIGFTKRYFEGVSFDDEDIAADVIKEIGIGGNYLTHEHTLENMREQLYFPTISKRNVKGNDAERVFRAGIYNRIDRMLESYKRPDFEPSRIAAMKRYLVSIGVNETLLTKIEKDAF